MTPNPAKHSQGDRLAGERLRVNEPMSSITDEAVERLNRLQKTLLSSRPTFAQNGQQKGWQGPDPASVQDAEAVEALLSTLLSKDREIARLREALTTIAVPGNGSHWGRLARQALSTTQDEGKQEVWLSRIGGETGEATPKSAATEGESS